MPCPVKRFIAKTTRGSKAMDNNTEELTPSKVDDLKRLAKCYSLLAGTSNIGRDVIREINSRIAEGLWHVMYDSITPKDGGAK